MKSPIWAEMELVRYFMPVLVACKFEEDPITVEGAFVSKKFFPALRQVTLKSKDGCGRNSNSSETL